MKLHLQILSLFYFKIQSSNVKFETWLSIRIAMPSVHPLHTVDLVWPLS